MFFNPQIVLGLSALIGAAAAGPISRRDELDPPADDCAAPWFGSSREDGVPWRERKAGADKYFCAQSWTKGLVITGMRIWTDPTRVTGIQMSYSDGSKSDIIGMQSVASTNDNSIEWAVDDKIEELRVWRSEDGGAVGRIRIKVAGRTLEIGGKVANKNVGTGMDVHSGMLLAVRGSTNNGPHLQTVEFRLLPSNPKSVELVTVNFPESLDKLNADKKGIDTVTLAQVYILNTNEPGSGANKTYQFGDTKEVRKSHRIDVGTEKTFGVTAGISIKGEVGFPGLAKAEAGFSLDTNFGYTWQNMDSREESHLDRLQWHETGQLLPGKAVNCEAKALTGHFESDFTSKIEVTMLDGTKFSYDQPGHYENVGYTQAWSNCQTMDAKDVPSGLSGDKVKEADP
ncbi:Hypothetical protein D9617_4g000840 [Elsinoe fawcettii]|nr:Hypothetical protein D9617_4g000840 [Elsinoe fawcettii]